MTLALAGRSAWESVILMRVTDHLYFYPWGDPKENNCNSVVIDGKLPLLIDPGHLHRVDDLKHRMKLDGFDPNRIKVVVATHAHPDHFEGAAAFHRHSVRVGLSWHERKFIEAVAPDLYRLQGPSLSEPQVDFYLREGTLGIGRFEFEVLLTPGHSPGSICLYWPRHRILISGDVVFMDSVGRSDLPGGDARTLKRSFERLSRLPVDLLLPGHGPAIEDKDRVKENFKFVRKVFFSAM